MPIVSRPSDEDDEFFDAVSDMEDRPPVVISSRSLPLSDPSAATATLQSKTEPAAQFAAIPGLAGEAASKSAIAASHPNPPNAVIAGRVPTTASTVPTPAQTASKPRTTQSCGVNDMSASLGKLSTAAPTVPVSPSTLQSMTVSLKKGERPTSPVGDVSTFLRVRSPPLAGDSARQPSKLSVSDLHTASSASEESDTDGKTTSVSIKSPSSGKSNQFVRILKKVSSSLLGEAEGVDWTEQDGYSSTGTHYLRIRGGRRGRKLFSRLVQVQDIHCDPAHHPLALSKSATSNASTAAVRTDPLQSLISQQADPNHGSQPIAKSTTAGSIGDAEARHAIWVMRFNRDGRFLATGGQDTIVRVWSLVSEPSVDETSDVGTSKSPLDSTAGPPLDQVSGGGEGSKSDRRLLRSTPYRVFRGHKADILDLSWSKNDFLLTSSMDKTVRLWHATRKECLCCFQHADFVTSIAFHPKDDRFFLSGCLDCRLRLWNIPEKKVSFWNELPDTNLITAVGFTLDGKVAIAGSYIGTCMFYETDGLKYITQIHVKSTRGKNSKGEKITGIEPMPNQPPGEEKILITTNDSRLRIYNMRDKSLFCKFKGHANASSQIRATFSDDGRYIISGSEDRYIYIWQSVPDDAVDGGSSDGEHGMEPTTSFTLQSLTSSRRDRNSAFESFEASTHIITCAVFAPRKSSDLLEQSGHRTVSSAESTDTTKTLPSSTPRPGDEDPRKRMPSAGTRPSSSMSVRSMRPVHRTSVGRFIVAGDFAGRIRVYENERLDRAYYAAVAGRDMNSLGVAADPSIRQSTESTLITLTSPHDSSRSP